jgi:hypothetical protein
MIDNSENQLKTEVVIPEVSRTETSKEVFNLQKRIAKVEIPAPKRAYQGLSGMKGNLQARFLGEGVVVTSLSYPAVKP